MTPEDADVAIITYCRERHRRENPPSLAGKLDEPHIESPPSDVWVEILLLTKARETDDPDDMRRGLDLWYLHAVKWCGHELDRDPELGIEQWLAIAPTKRMLERYYALPAGEAKRLMGLARDVVTEKLGNRRAEERMQRERLFGWLAIAEHTGMSVSWCKARAREDGLPVYKAGGIPFALRDEVDAWFRERPRIKSVKMG